MNTKLLLELFKIPAPSYSEEIMAEYIKNKLNELKIPYKQDSMGNIYNTSYNNKPLLCAHMDTVQDNYDLALIEYINIKNNCLSGYGVIGGDDKCGIYIILETLKNREVNFLFCVQEEVGGRGSSSWILGRRLDHIPYGLVLDRMGNTDILCTQNDYGVRELEIFLHEVGKDFGYSPAMGTFSDADSLNEVISCANLSVGYYGQHTKHEFVDLVDLEQAFKYVNAIITHVKETFKKPEKTRYDYRSNKNWYGYDDGYGNGNDYDEKKKKKDDNLTKLGVTMADIECVSCGVIKPTAYISCVNSFICYDCIQFLKDELDGIEQDLALEMDEEWRSGW